MRGKNKFLYLKSCSLQVQAIMPGQFFFLIQNGAVYFSAQIGYNSQVKHPVLSSMHIPQLNSESNLIKTSYTSNQYEDQIVQHPNSALKECRICLSQSHQSQTIFISPCKCSGSIKYVHQPCLKRWMELKLLPINQEDNCQTTIVCELCKTEIPYQIRVKSEWRSCCQVKEEIKVKCYNFTLYAIFFIVSLTLLAYSIYQITKEINSGLGDSKDSVKIACIYVGALLISLLTFTYSIYCLRDFFIKKRMELVLQNKQQ